MKKKKDKNGRLPFFGIPKLLPYARVYHNKIIVMVLLGFLCSMIDAALPLANRFALDHFIGERDLTYIGAFIFIYLLLLLVQSAANYVCTYFCGDVEVSINRDMRNQAFSHLQTLSFSYFNTNNVGYIHARVMSDTGKIGELVAWKLMDIIWNGTYIIGCFIVMLTVNVRLTLLFAIFVPFAVALIMVFQEALTRLNKKLREMNSIITSDYNEGITGAKTIKTLDIKDVITKDFRRDAKKMYKTAVKTARVSALFTSTVTFLGSMVLAMVLWRGGIVTFEGVITIGTLSVFISYALGILEPIQSIVRTVAGLIAIQVNIKRFFDLMETEPDVADSPEVVEKYGDTFHPKRENWEPLYGDIEFRDVWFKYPDGGDHVLTDFNLKVDKGTKVAIVGETGAGKSTLVNLLCRFYEPTSGEVLIDGVPANMRSQLWLHERLGYVLQTPHLFSGTVRENLRYGKPDATDDEIREALRAISADEVVDRMGNGLNSEVGEGGDLLSTGEKQLLALARALVADPAILVLDEATASIDTVTEKKIQDAMRLLTKDRTSFVIAHRLSTITDADIIIAVSDGKIVEQGTHESLLEKKGYYFELYNNSRVESAFE